MTALATTLAARAAGQIDDRDVAKIADLVHLLYAGNEKVASPVSGIGGRVMEGLARGAENAVAPLLLGMGVGAAGMAGRSLYDKATKGPDLGRILAVYPHLAEQFPRAEIELAYNSMRHMNPHIAKDPLAGGTLLGQMLRSRDVSNPKAMRFEANLAGELIRMRPQEEHRIEDAAQQGVQIGVTKAIEDIARTRQLGLQQAFQHAENKTQRDFELLRDTDKLHASRMDALDDRAWRSGESAIDRAHRETESARDRSLRGQQHNETLTQRSTQHAQDFGQRGEQFARRNELEAAAARRSVGAARDLERLKASERDKYQRQSRPYEEQQKKLEGMRQDQREVLRAMLTGKDSLPQLTYTTSVPKLDANGNHELDAQGNVVMTPHKMLRSPYLAERLNPAHNPTAARWPFLRP